MTDESRTRAAATPEKSAPAAGRPLRRALLPLPGLAAISLYLLVLSGVIILGVAGTLSAAVSDSGGGLHGG